MGFFVKLLNVGVVYPSSVIRGKVIRGISWRLSLLPAVLTSFS